MLLLNDLTYPLYQIIVVTVRFWVTIIGTMQQLYIIAILVLIILLVVVKSFSPDRTKLSSFEISRLIKLGDKRMNDIVNRDKTVIFLTFISKVIYATLLSILSYIFFVELKPFNAVIAIAAVVLVLNILPQSILLNRISNRLFKFCEKSTLKFLKKNPFLFNRIKLDNREIWGADSLDEFRHFVNKTEDGVLSLDEKKIISSALIFDKTTVKEIMTPLEEVAFIERSEFLGPLVLDELHKTGHSKLPVVAKDLNHIVGILYLDKLLSLDVKRSVTAGKAMNPKVVYINQDQTLRYAVIKMLEMSQNIVVVKNDNQNVGIITMRDILEFLFDQELVD